MEKEYKAVLIVDLSEIDRAYKETALVLGPDNVTALTEPKQVFALLQMFHPEVLIIDPEFFLHSGVRLEDLEEHRKSRKYKIIALYPNREKDDRSKECGTLHADAEYAGEIDYLEVASQIPGLCKHSYIYRKTPLFHRTNEQICRILADCGFSARSFGFRWIAEALTMQYLDPDLLYFGGAQKIYQTIGEKYDKPPRIVERSIQRFLAASWTPQTRANLFAELQIPDHYEPGVNFGDFTLLFSTYYTKKYGQAKIYLTKPKKKYRSADIV